MTCSIQTRDTKCDIRIGNILLVDFALSSSARGFDTHCIQAGKKESQSPRPTTNILILAEVVLLGKSVLNWKSGSRYPGLRGQDLSQTKQLPDTLEVSNEFMC